MKFVSWNVNGIRACINKGFFEIVNELNADFFSVQEVKAMADQVDLEIEGYHHFLNSAERKGYSGTLIYARKEPISVKYGIGNNAADTEGRVITLEYPTFYLVNVYVPNSKNELARIEERCEFEDDFRDYLIDLRNKKSVVLCGDLNVAHQEIDLKNPKSNRKNPGFSDQEREKFTQLLDNGFTDTFRYLYPEATGMYSWWSYRFNARKNNAGWRIDYFVVSEDLNDKIQEASIEADIFGSDHCPVTVNLDI